MGRDEVEPLLADVYDQALLTHGFADHARDYEIEFERGKGERLRYVFRHCVAARVTSALAPRVWALSLGDELLAADAQPSGYVWGVRWQVVYPGGSVVEPSEEAERWSAAVGVPFQQVRIETNVQVIDLVFTSLTVEPGAVASGG